MSFFAGFAAGWICAAIVFAAFLWFMFLRPEVRKANERAERIGREIAETRESIRKGARRSEHRFQL